MAQVEPETMLGRDRGAETEDMDIEQPVQESHAGKPTGAVSELSAAPGPTAAPLDVAVTQDSAAPAEGHVQDGRTMTNVDSTEASTAQDEANAEGTAGDSAGRRTGQSLTPPHEELLGTWIDSKYFQVFSPSRRGSQPSLSAGDQPSSMEEQPRAREAASPELAEGRLASENVHDNALPPSTASGQFLDAHDAEEMVISRSGDSSRARSRSPPKRGGSVDSIENESSASASYLSMPLSPDGNIDSPSESAALFDDRAAGLTTQVEEAASEKSTSEDVEKRFFQSGAVDGAEKGARGPDGGIEKTVEPEEVVLSVFAAKKKQRNYRLPTTPVPITTRRAANKAHEAVVKPVESVPVKDSDPVVQEVVSPTVEAGPKVTVPPSAPENLAPATAQLEVQKAGSRSPKKRSSTASPRRGARNAKTEDTPRAALPQNEAADDGEVGLKSPGSPVKSAPSSGTTKRRQRRRLIDDTGDPLTEDYSMVVDRKPPPRTMPVVKDDILPVPPSPKVERDDESELSSLDEIIEQTLREGSMVSMGESVADESLQEGSVGGPPDGDVDMEIANGESAMEDAVEDAGPREVRKYKRRRRKRKSEVGPKRKRGTGGASDAEAGRGGDDGEGERGNKAKRRKGGRDPFGTSGGRYLGVSAPSNLQNPFRAMERKNLTYVTGEEMDAEAIKNDVAVQEQQLAASEGGEGAGDNARRSHRKPMSAMDRFFTPAAPPRDLNVDFSQLDDSVKQELNDDFCSACDVSQGQLMCCDSCPKSFHFICANPPLDPQNLPEGRWECRACTGKRAAATAKEHDGDKTKETAAPAKSLFGALLEKLEVMNPTQFKLPKNIRRSFLGYARHPETGDFLDLTENKLAKAAKPNPETFESTTAICFKCCSLGTIPKIIQCDFCDLWWHLDCLNPPLAHPPNLSVVPIDVDVEQPETSDGTPRQGATIPTGNRQRDEDEQATQLLSSGLPLGMRKKWMCPCHADLHVPARRRKAWGENVVDVPVAAEVADGADPASWNEGNIEVVVDAPNPKLGVRGEFDSAEKIGAAIIPGAGLAQFLETGGVQDRDGSPEPEERRAPVLKPTPTVDVVRFDTNEEYQSMAFEDVIYRVPEKRIKLDFIRQLRHLSRKRQAAREEQEQAGWQSEFYGADITDGLMTLARAALGDSNGKDAMEIDESTVSTTPPAEVSVSDNMPEVIRKGDALYEEFMAWKRSAVATTGST